MSKATDSPDDRTIVSYWTDIAGWWTKTVRGGIPSRELVTNRALIDAVIDRSPRSVIDLGCGEGWLCRALLDHGMKVLGVDAVPELIEQARATGGGEYLVASYDQVAGGLLTIRADVVVCNFSLLGKDSVNRIFQRIPSLLSNGGAFIVQTLHPLEACGDQPYVDGWRRSPWTGITEQTADPSPWYFRTFRTWMSLFSENGLRIVEILEPLHPGTQRPASVIFIAEAADLQA